MTGKLTPKREKFCREIAKGKSQADAYRAAFNAKNMKDKTIYERASVLASDSNVRARIEQLTERIVAKVTMTREEWLLEMEKMMRGDIRRMFDSFGNPIEVPELGDNEAAMVEGFEFEEQFTKVKKGSGETDAVPTGYIKKYKLTPRLKRALEFGKVMGWYQEDVPVAPKMVFIRKWVNQEVNHVYPDPHTGPVVDAEQPPGRDGQRVVQPSHHRHDSGDRAETTGAPGVARPEDSTGVAAPDAAPAVPDAAPAEHVNGNVPRCVRRRTLGKRPSDDV